MAQNYDVDFTFVRNNSDFGQVLAHYGIEAIGDGSQVKVLCPFHDDTKPSLAVNIEKNLFNCFACDAQGNILDFVIQKEDLKPRPAGIKLAQICGIPCQEGGSVNGSNGRNKRSAPTEADVPGVTADQTADSAQGDHVGEENDDALANKPLTFELKLDNHEHHPWLDSRGITPDRVSEFGVGLASKGVMQGRLAIPIHNSNGDLVAYCGRYPADAVPDDEAKYLFPKGFRKEIELFGLHRSPKNQTSSVLLVESFVSAMKHWSRDTPVFSPMGRSISSQQVQLLLDWGVKRVGIVFDGDRPGREGAQKVAGAIASAGMWVKIARTPDGMKPHHMSYEEMLNCFHR